jgi:hypothetical protein
MQLGSGGATPDYSPVLQDIHAQLKRIAEALEKLAGGTAPKP